MPLVAMIEADAGCGPLLTALFEDDLSYCSICQDTQIGAMRIRQVVRRRGVRSCGSLRVDRYYIRPCTNIRSGQMRFVRLKAQLIEGLVPVSVRLGVLWQIRDVERTANAHRITTVIDLMLLLLCRIRRLDKVLAFLIKWASCVSGSRPLSFA